MCWSLEVSFAFASIELVGCIYLFLRNGKLDRAILPICLMVFLIEASEIFMWWSNPTPLNATCSTMNNWATRITRVILIAQPMACNFMCLKTCNKEVKQKFEILFNLSVFSFLVGTALVFYAEIYKEKPYENAIMNEWHKDPTGAVGLVTCSYLGPNGHLLWKYRAHAIDAMGWFPNTFFYIFVGMVAPIIHHRPWMDAGFIVCVMLVEFILVSLWFRTSESFSVWCWTGMTVHAWAIAYPFLYSRMFPKEKEK